MKFSLTKKQERGQALTELALSITVLLIMVAGAVDLGRIIFHYIAMRDAAQEAAAYGYVNPTHCDQIRDRAWIAMASSPFVTVTTTIDGVPCSVAASDPSRACFGKEIIVSLADPQFPITMPFIGTFLGRQSVSLEAQITGTILRPACE